jgi:hypothetical protein
MQYARIEDGVVQDVILMENEETLQALFLLGAFPEHVLFVPCPEGYSLGDLYEAGEFTRKDGSTVPGLLPSPEKAPSVEDDLLSIAVDHEYRLALLELGVVN